MFTTTLYLDRRTIRKDGRAQVKVSVNAHGSSAYLPTGIWVEPSAWDNRRRRLRNMPSAMAALEGFRSRVATLILTLVTDGTLAGLTATEAKNIIRSRLDPTAADGNVYDAVMTFAGKRKSASSRCQYESVARRLDAYDRSVRRRPLTSLTRAWLDGFDRSLADLAANTRADYLQKLRTVIRAAADDGMPVADPFKGFKMPRREASHRSLSLSALRRVMTDGGLTGRAAYYADLFRLSFMLVGMNTADLYAMTAPHDGRVEYRRRKTGKVYSVKVEPEAAAIIDRHRGRDHYLDFADDHTSVATLTVLADKALKTVLPGLTMYYARHSWATVAAELDIPVDTISRALGHTFTTGAAVTSVYIEFDRRKIDAANRRVLDYVLYGRRG